jgi:hypothetical protein
MKRLLPHSILIWATLAVSRGEYSEQVSQWPQARLQLSQEVTLADLFTPGLRPYLRPNAERRNVYAKHAHITIVDREGRILPPIPADILRTTVDKPWLIAAMEIWTPPLTINEARAEMRKWLPITGRSEKELDDFLRAVEADWLRYDVVNGKTDVVRFADGWWDKDRVKYTLWLMKSWQWQAPLRLCFKVETYNLKSRRPIISYEGPIPPPPGFEGANMKAPEGGAHEDDRFIPVTTEPRAAQGTLPPQYQAMNNKGTGEAVALTSAKVVQPQTAPVKSASNKMPASTTVTEKPTSATAWSIILATIVVLSGLLWLFFRRRS